MAGERNRKTARPWSGMRRGLCGKGLPTWAGAWPGGACQVTCQALKAGIVAACRQRAKAKTDRAGSPFLLIGAVTRAITQPVLRLFRRITHRAAIPLMEVLHAVFHRRLIRAGFAHAAPEQRLAPGIHALGDLVVFRAGFHIGR